MVDGVHLENHAFWAEFLGLGQALFGQGILGFSDQNSSQTGLHVENDPKFRVKRAPGPNQVWPPCHGLFARLYVH